MFDCYQKFSFCSKNSIQEVSCVYIYVLLRAKKVGHQISVSFEKFDVVQPLLSFFDTIPADNLKIYFIRLFSFSKCPLLLIKVDFDWNFALNKYSLRAYLQSFPTTYNT
jgi:hypothetical protein